MRFSLEYFIMLIYKWFYHIGPGFHSIYHPYHAWTKEFDDAVQARGHWGWYLTTMCQTNPFSFYFGPLLSWYIKAWMENLDFEKICTSDIKQTNFGTFMCRDNIFWYILLLLLTIKLIVQLDYRQHFCSRYWNAPLENISPHCEPTIWYRPSRILDSLHLFTFFGTPADIYSFLRYKELLFLIRRYR